MIEIQKGLILVYGIPASGKTYLSACIKLLFDSCSINSKILSTDNLEAFLSQQQNHQPEKITEIFYSPQWDQKLPKFLLNKKTFDEKFWNISRKLAQNPKILDQIFQSCSILIIQDEMPLKSQRKPFRKYSCERNIKFLEIQVQASLEEAIQNNLKRGELDEKNIVHEQVIRKSYQKIESSGDTLVLSPSQFSVFLDKQRIISSLKPVQIDDNYTEYLNKKKLPHEQTEKELDENELRRLIAKIIKDEEYGVQYLGLVLSTKQKSNILSECKRTYIEKKRKVAFKYLVTQFLQHRYSPDK